MESAQLQQELTSYRNTIHELQSSYDHSKREKLQIEEEHKITIEKHVKEIRETQTKLTKVSSKCQ